MANNLTGEYEAVVQVAVRQLNGVLATLHQNKINPALSPSFQHSTTLRVGKAPLSLEAESVRFKKWLQYAAAPPAAATLVSAENRRTLLSAKAPPGLAVQFEKAWSLLDAAITEIAPSGNVRGVARVQLSNPTISLPDETVSQVEVSVYVRAHYVPDPGSKPLPDPIHGEVRVRYTVRPAYLPDGRGVLKVEVSPDDQHIQFIPEPDPDPANTITAAGRALITTEVRRAVRDKFKANDVDLGSDFAFTVFTGLGTGANQAVALPIQLTAGPLNPHNIGSITNHFLGASELAIAVSKEYVSNALDALVSNVKENVDAFIADYTVSISNFLVDWKAGSISLSGKVNLETDALYAPNGEITFSQTIVASLDAVTQQISLKPAGEPIIDESVWIPHDTAVDKFKSALDKALTSAGTAFSKHVTNARTKLAGGLQKFDKSTSVKYTAIEITPDGLIVRGAIGTGWRIDPVLSFTEGPDPAVVGGRLFDAFLTWIPAGRIETYNWTWVEWNQVPWFSETQSFSSPHRFVCVKPATIASTQRVCFQVVGTRLNPNGDPEQVSAGEVCKVTSHEPILVAPPWWMKVYVPIWLPDWPPDVRPDDMIAAHLSVAGNVRSPGVDVANVVVHFAGRRIDRPLELLARALSQRRRQEASAIVVLVLPVGAFTTDRRELEAALGSPGDRFKAPLHVTEDYATGWSRAFAAPEGPSTFLMNARGEFVWRHNGMLDAEHLAGALDEFLLPAPPAESRVMRLTVEPGQPVPDIVLTDEQGTQIPMRRLRRRPVLLTFWQSWSSACIRELRRLQRLHERGDGMRVFAVNGGEDRAVFAAVRRDHKLTIPLIQDPREALAAFLDVRCWPTTISINSEGVVDHIQFGVTHDDHRAADTGQIGR